MVMDSASGPLPSQVVAAGSSGTSSGPDAAHGHHLLAHGRHQRALGFPELCTGESGTKARDVFVIAHSPELTESSLCIPVGQHVVRHLQRAPTHGRADPSQGPVSTVSPTPSELFLLDQADPFQHVL